MDLIDYWNDLEEAEERKDWGEYKNIIQKIKKEYPEEYLKK